MRRFTRKKIMAGAVVTAAFLLVSGCAEFGMLLEEMTAEMSSMNAAMDATDLSDTYYNPAGSGSSSGSSSSPNYNTNPAHSAYQSCFAAGTWVLMGDGELKKIEDIRVSDEVLAFDEFDPTTDDLKVCRVNEIYRTKDAPVIHAGGVLVTRGHRFVSESGEWEKIRHLNKAHTLNQGVKPTDTDLANVLTTDVYNFNVEGLHTYIIKGKTQGEDCFWRVHNQGRRVTVE